MTKRLDRRNLLKSAATGAIASSVVTSIPPDGSAASQRQSNRIQQENQLEGTTDWQLTRFRPNENAYRTSLIEGYCSHQSVAAGETLKIFVSTKPSRKFTLDIYRMGYYGGAGGRHMQQLEARHAVTQPVPEMGPLPGRLRECAWEPSFEIKIPDDWFSGVYLGKLTTIPESPSEPYWQSYVIFIVRDNRPADFLFQCSDNTWQAYNKWPVNESLYTHPDGAHAPGVAVSFDRPYGKYTQIFDHPLSAGSGEFLLWERIHELVAVRNRPSPPVLGEGRRFGPGPLFPGGNMVEGAGLAGEEHEAGGSARRGGGRKGVAIPGDATGMCG